MPEEFILQKSAVVDKDKRFSADMPVAAEPINAEL